MVSPIGRLGLAALDCTDPAALAGFYQSIIGGVIVDDGTDDGRWVEVHTPEGKIACQRIEDHQPPTWPSGDIPQQAHLDIDVDDLAAGEIAVLALGAVKAETQPHPDSFRVFFDPAGHPFCLVQA